MGAESLVQITLLAGVTFGLHIFEFKTIYKCAPTYSIVSLTDTGLLVVFCFALWMLGSRYECLSMILSFISGIGMSFLSPPGLFLLLKTMINDRNCIPTYLQRLDLSVFIFLVLMELVVFCILGCVIATHRNEKKRKEEAKLEFQQIYENILKPDFNLDEFFQKHGEIVDKLGLSEKELAVLNDKFGKEFTEDQSTLDQNDRKECSICLGEFEKGDHLVIHPQCNHNFHSACLGNWLKNDNSGCFCPMCKLGSRRAMLTQIRQTMFGDTSAPSTISGQSGSPSLDYQPVPL